MLPFTAVAGGVSFIVVPEMKRLLTPSRPATKTHSKLAITKWLIVEPISSQDPSSLTTQKKYNVKISVSPTVSMKMPDGATPILLFTIPRFAEIKAKGIKIFKIRSAP